MKPAFAIILLGVAASSILRSQAAQLEPTLTRDGGDLSFAQFTLKNTTSEALFISPICILETREDDQWIASRPVLWNERPGKTPRPIPAGGSVQLTCVVVAHGMYPWRATALLLRAADDKKAAFTVRTEQIPARPIPAQKDSGR